MSLMALPSDALGARLNETVTAGNCPWWLIESASVVDTACVNALSGMAVEPADEVEVFGVVPAVTPALAEDPELDAGATMTRGGTVSTPELGLYFTDVVR